MRLLEILTPGVFRPEAVGSGQRLNTPESQRLIQPGQQIRHRSPGSDEADGDGIFPGLLRSDADQAEALGRAGNAGTGILRVEGIADLDGNTGLHGWGDRRSIEHLGTATGHVQGGLVRHSRHGPGLGDVFRVRGHDAGHVGPDLERGGMHRSGIDGGAVIRTAAAEGRDAAGTVPGDESRHDDDLRALPDRRGNPPVAFRKVVRNDQLAGVQPLRQVVFAAQFLRQDLRGEDLAEGHFLGVRRGHHLLEEPLQQRGHLLLFAAGEKAAGDAQMPLQQALAALDLTGGGRIRRGYLQQRIRAAADGGGHEDDLSSPLHLRAHDVEHAGNVGCGRDGRAAEFQYTVHSL